MNTNPMTRLFSWMLLGFLALGPAALAQSYEVYCQDGIDNDGDNRIDTNPAGTPPGNLGPDSDCQCFDDVVPGTLQCTANDLGFVVVGLGTQTDGCVNASDMVGIQFGATLATTGTNRYDIGMWVALDGGNARTGKCARQILVPPITPVDFTPTPAQLNSGNGPFRNEDAGDLCADLEKSDDPDGTSTFNARYNFKDLNTGPLFNVQPEYQLSCGNASNGVLNISTCVSYEQNAQPTCSSINDAIPGTGSKCRCQGPPTFQSNIPVPNLALSCGCTNNADGSVSCEMTYSNLGQGTCTQVSSAGETEFSCGTARYVRFRTAIPTTGSITTGPSTCTPQTSGTTTANCPAGPGRGSASVIGNELFWIPRNDPGVGTGNLGWVGVNETERLRFTFTQSVPGPVALSFPTLSDWANDSTFAGAVAQTTLTCPFAITTPVTLETFATRREADELVVEWQTGTEAGNAGFNLWAETAGGKVKLTDTPIPSSMVDSLSAAFYQVRLPAEGLEGARIYLEELSVRGDSRQHGPFPQEVRIGEPTEEEPIDWTSIRAENDDRQEKLERRERRAAFTESAAVGQGAANGGPRVYPTVDLRVDADGIQRVSYEALTAAGADYSGVKATDFVLELRGTQVPITVGGARTFGAGSYIEFVGRALDTLYTGTNVYSLRVDRRGARAVADATAPGSAAPVPYYVETARVARNRQYSFGTQIGDPWFDTYLMSFGQPTTTDVAVAADAVVSGPASLRIETWGVTGWPAENDHHLVTRFNGVTTSDDRFDGQIVHTVAVDLPAGAVAEGANTLTLVQPGDAGVPGDFVAFEGVELDYRRAFVARADRLTFTAAGARFAVSGFTQPNLVAYRESADGALALLTGATVTAGPNGYTVSLPGSAAPATYHVAATGALVAPSPALARDPSALDSGDAELLIVSHPSFIDGLAPLVQARRNQGFTVKVVDVRDVYARDGYGVVDPEAIRRYVAFAYANLGTRYVLVVGGDSYDYRGYTNAGSLSFVPSIYARTGPYVSFAPVDPLFGDVDGNGVPDIAVGRFPVRTAAELDALIAKTLAYDSKSYGGTAVLAADSYDAASANNFAVMSDELAGALDDSWSLTKAYIDNDGVLLAKAKLVGAINEGVALTTYIGHSGPTRWTFQGLLQSPDVAALANPGTPTVVAQFGCWNGYYVSPAYDGMVHRFLLSGDRGAAAVLGATGLTETASDRAFGAELMPRLAAPGWTIGDAVQEARSAVAATHPEMIDVILGFAILGDPTLAVEP